VCICSEWSDVWYAYIWVFEVKISSRLIKPIIYKQDTEIVVFVCELGINTIVEWWWHFDFWIVSCCIHCHLWAIFRGYLWCGDGACNTVEENSRVFSLIQLCYLPSVLWHCWLSGRKGIRPVKIWGMVEVGTAYTGWSGAQPDGRCVCLC